MKEAQLATHYVASERLPALEEALHSLGAQTADPENIGRTLQFFEVPSPAVHCLLLCLLPNVISIPPSGLDTVDVSVSCGCVQDATELTGSSGLLKQLPAINECFRYNTVEEIYAALESRGDAWSRETLDSLHKRAPPSNPSARLLTLQHGADICVNVSRTLHHLQGIFSMFAQHAPLRVLGT